MDNKSKVYILLDGESRIIRCEGGYGMANIKDISEWIFIDEGEGDRYNHCQTAYFAGGLRTIDGICRWRYVEGKCVLRSDEEIEEERQSRPAPYDERADMDAALDMLGVSR